MANPYHDDTGKFCSKGEMQSALKRLASAGDTQGYFKLQAEYEAIETEKRLKDVSDASAMLAIAMRDNRTSNLELIERINQTENPEIIRAVAEADTSNWNIYLTDAVLKNPNTPDDVKQQIVSEISDSSVRAIIDAPTIAPETKLAVFNVHKGEPDLVSRLLADGKTLDPDTAYEYATKYPNTLDYYVKGYGIRSPEIEETLRNRILAFNKNPNSGSSLALIVGKKAKDEATINACIQNLKYGADHFIENPYFTQNNAAELLHKSNKYDYAGFKQLLSAPLNKTRFQNILQKLEEAPLAPLKPKSPTSAQMTYVKNELRKTKLRRAERPGDSTIVEYGNYIQANVDTYEDTYNKLVKEHATASKKKNLEKTKELQNRIDNVHSFRKTAGERQLLASIVNADS